MMMMHNNRIIRLTTHLTHLSTSRGLPRPGTNRTNIHRLTNSRQLSSSGHSRLAQNRLIQIVLLIGGLDSDDEIGRVGDHHVSDLIERLAGDFDAVDLDDLVVDREQTGGLGQAAWHETRDEDARDLFDTVRGHAKTAAVADVEAEWFARFVFVEANATVALW